jgi:hypothetical protein
VRRELQQGNSAILQREREKNMSLCIKRIEELPGRYNDRQQAELAIKQILAAYKENGRNAQQDYWWAHDAEGKKFRFVIDGESEGAA